MTMTLFRLDWLIAGTDPFDGLRTMTVTISRLDWRITGTDPCIGGRVICVRFWCSFRTPDPAPGVCGKGDVSFLTLRRQ